MKYCILFVLLSFTSFSQEAVIINNQDSGIVIINHIYVNGKPRWYVDKVFIKKNNLWEEYRMIQVSYHIIEAKHLITSYEQFIQKSRNKTK